MPRLCDADNVALDFCNWCFMSEDEAEIMFPNNLGWDCNHPDYSQEDYECCECGAKLQDGDN